jgi:serine protease Do
MNSPARHVSGTGRKETIMGPATTIKHHVPDKLRWNSCRGAAHNPVAAYDRCSSRSLLVLCIMIALRLGVVSPQPAQAEPPPDPIANIVTKVKQAVVEVIVVRPKDDEEKSDEQTVKTVTARATAIGSGFVIDPSGYIATNKHVVRDAVAVFIATPDGIRYQARIIGMAGKADMALLKIDTAKELPAVPFGDSDAVHVGDAVVAIGSPFGFDDSVTAGIVSAVNRDIMESPFDDYIQTDAPINHGNSGGPLFNLAGEVIGMNSVIFAPGTYSGSAGVGFAIPSNDLHFVMDRLKVDGKVKVGMLPIRTQQVTWMIQQGIGTPGLQGALVAALEPGGNAMMDGQIKPGDVVLSFNGQTVLDPRDLARKAARAPIGSDAALTIWRGRVQQDVHIKIQAWPEAQPHLISELAPRTVGLQLASAPQGGVVIASVDPSGSAADSGVEKGDVILQVQEQPVSDPDQASRVLQALSAEKRGYAVVLIYRNDNQTWIPIAIPE